MAEKVEEIEKESMPNCRVSLSTQHLSVRLLTSTQADDIKAQIKSPQAISDYDHMFTSAVVQASKSTVLPALPCAVW